jgi:hypothetical protein
MKAPKFTVFEAAIGITGSGLRLWSFIFSIIWGKGRSSPPTPARLFEKIEGA